MINLAAEQTLPNQRFLRELETQLVVTSGLEARDRLALPGSLSTKYYMVSEKTTTLHIT